MMFNSKYSFYRWCASIEIEQLKINRLLYSWYLYMDVWRYMYIIYHTHMYIYIYIYIYVCICCICICCICMYMLFTTEVALESCLLAWVGFEPTTTEFRSYALTDWAIRPWVQLALRANFVQLLQFHRLFSVTVHFGHCLCHSPRLF